MTATNSFVCLLQLGTDDCLQGTFARAGKHVRRNRVGWLTFLANTFSLAGLLHHNTNMEPKKDQLLVSLDSEKLFLPLQELQGDLDRKCSKARSDFTQP